MEKMNSFGNVVVEDAQEEVCHAVLKDAGEVFTAKEIARFLAESAFRETRGEHYKEVNGRLAASKNPIKIKL